MAAATDAQQLERLRATARAQTSAFAESRDERPERLELGRGARPDADGAKGRAASERKARTRASTEWPPRELLGRVVRFDWIARAESWEGEGGQAGSSFPHTQNGTPTRLQRRFWRSFMWQCYSQIFPRVLGIFEQYISRRHQLRASFRTRSMVRNAKGASGLTNRVAVLLFGSHLRAVYALAVDLLQ